MDRLYEGRDTAGSWDVEAEIQKELDSLSECEYTSTTSNEVPQAETDEKDGRGSLQSCEDSGLSNLLRRWNAQREKLRFFKNSLCNIGGLNKNISSKRFHKQTAVTAEPKLLNLIRNMDTYGDSRNSKSIVDGGGFTDDNNVRPANQSKEICIPNAKGNVLEAPRRVGRSMQSIKAVQSKSDPHYRLSDLHGKDTMAKEQQEKIIALEKLRQHKTQLFAQLTQEEVKRISLERAKMEYQNLNIQKHIEKIKILKDQMERRRLDYIKEKQLETNRIQAKQHLAAKRIAKAWMKWKHKKQEYCIIIQAFIRGYNSRRKYQNFKLQRYQEIADFEAEKACNSVERIDHVHLQYNAILNDNKAFEKDPSECHAKPVGREPERNTKVETDVKSEAEMIKKRLANILKVGNVSEFNLMLERTKYLGFHEEMADLEDQLTQMKENTKLWLSQVIDGWETSKSRIVKMISQAQRLGLEELGAAADAAISARERDIYDNIELALNKCSGQSYQYWMQKAKIMGIDDNLDKFIADFKDKLTIMKDTLIQTASKGTKDECSIAFQKGRSLGLDSYVYQGMQIIKKRVFRVLRRAIYLALATSNAVSSKRDWKPLELEGYWLGINPETLRLVKTATARAQKLASSKLEAWATFKTDELGIPIERQSGRTEIINSQSHGLEFECNKSNELDFESCSEMTMDLPVAFTFQDWEELERLRNRWQQCMLLIQKHKGHATRGCFMFDSFGQGSNATSMPGKCLDFSKIEACRKGSKIWSYEEDKREENTENAVRDKLKSQEKLEQVDSSVDTHGLYIDELENSLHMNMTFAPPLVLTNSIIECKLNCRSDDLASVASLNLSNEGLSSLGEGVLSYWCPRMKILTANMNRLNNLQAAFKGCEEFLERISLKDNFISTFQGFEHLYNLQVLHLEGNCITRVIASEASEIQPSGTGSTSVNNKVLAKKTTMKESNNCFWPRLKELHLGCNRISDVFELEKLCPDLEVLDLGSNNISSLGGPQGMALSGLEHLRVLDVGQNKIEGCSLWRALKHCPLLVSLIASRNRITEIPPEFGSAFLREIWLNGNAIKNLPSTVWMPNLQRLYLQDNAIDTLEPLPGCPFLEVLDLSFNRLSETSRFQQLGCLGHLRSLQLNDNPVSEMPDYIDRVLQAVPWLAELDNEVVLESFRHKALQNIVKQVIHASGTEYFKRKAFTGQIPFLGLADPKKMQAIEVSPHINKPQLIFRPDKVSLARSSVSLSDIMNGTSDQAVLWGALSSIVHESTTKINMAFLRHTEHAKNGFQASSLLSHLEAEWKFHAFQLMCFSQKERLLYTTKDKSFVRNEQDFETSSLLCAQDDHLKSEEELNMDVPSCNQSASKPNEANRTIRDLQFCLYELVNFDDCKYKEVYEVGCDYKRETRIQKERIVKIQALLRGFLARLGFRKAKFEKSKSEFLITKVQAHWKGWKCRSSRLLECLRQESQKMKLLFESAAKIQAHWRGYRARIMFHQMKHMISKIIKIQACWKGHRTRMLFHQAFSNIKYTDDDDFDYVAVDESELSLNWLDLDINIPENTFFNPILPNSVDCSIFSSRDNVEYEDGVQAKMRDLEIVPSPRNKEFQLDAAQAEQQMLETDISSRVEEFQLGDAQAQHTQSCSEISPRIMEFQIDNVPAKKRELETEKTPRNEEFKLHENGQVEQRELESEISPRAEEFQTDVGESGKHTAVQQITEREETLAETYRESSLSTPSHSGSLANVLPVTVEKKATMAEISREWGFKNEKTTLQFLKALEHTKRQAKDKHPIVPTLTGSSKFVGKLRKGLDLNSSKEKDPKTLREGVIQTIRKSKDEDDSSCAKWRKTIIPNTKKIIQNKVIMKTSVTTIELGQPSQSPHLTQSQKKIIR